MTILYLLIPLTLILLAVTLWAFFWAVRNDQFEDLEGPAHRILFDEDENDLTPEERQRRRDQAGQPPEQTADHNSKPRQEDPPH